MFFSRLLLHPAAPDDDMQSCRLHCPQPSQCGQTVDVRVVHSGRGLSLDRQLGCVELPVLRVWEAVGSDGTRAKTEVWLALEGKGQRGLLGHCGPSRRPVGRGRIKLRLQFMPY
jgi:hypothetical protein